MSNTNLSQSSLITIRYLIVVFYKISSNFHLQKFIYLSFFHKMVNIAQLIFLNFY